MEQKENLILQLCDEIQEVRRELEFMENSNLQKNKKIKLLLEENINLSDQLESSSMATLVRSRNQPTIDLD